MDENFDAAKPLDVEALPENMLSPNVIVVSVLSVVCSAFVAWILRRLTHSKRTRAAATAPQNGKASAAFAAVAAKDVASTQFMKSLVAVKASAQEDVGKKMTVNQAHKPVVQPSMAALSNTEPELPVVTEDEGLLSQKTAVHAVTGKRAVMADSHFVMSLGSRSLAMCVFDGCGGPKASAFAAKTVRELLAARPEMALEHCLRQTEQATLKKASKEKFLDGTTAVVARVDFLSRKLDLAWIGDSRCILARRVGVKMVAETLTRDHNASDKTEQKRIRDAGGHVGRTESEAKASNSRKMFGKVFGSSVVFGLHRSNPKRVYPGGITLTRAIGALPLKIARPQLVIADPEAVPTITLDDNDKFIILASDGLFEGLDPQHAVDVVTGILTEQSTAIAKQQLERAAKSLVSAAQDNGSTDNTTVCLLLLE